MAVSGMQVPSSSAQKQLGAHGRGQCSDRSTSFAGRRPCSSATVIGDAISLGFLYLQCCVLNSSPPFCTVRIEWDKNIKMCKEERS